MKTTLGVLTMLFIGLSGQTGADDSKLPIPDKESIAKFLTVYQKTPFAERGEYVTDSEEFEKVQENYYKNRQIVDDVEITVTSVKAHTKADYLTVVAKHKVTLNGIKSTQVKDYYLMKTKDGLKLDWSANAGYNPVGFKAWAAGTDKSLTLRVEVELSDTYYFQYFDAKETHYSISCEEKYGGRSDSFHGYVTKNSALGKKLFDIVKDGQKCKLTVAIERTGSETRVVGIKELVSETWVK